MKGANGISRLLPFLLICLFVCPLSVEGATITTGRVATGVGHSVVLKPDGTVWTWGRNDHGQLGDGSAADRSFPIRVAGVNGAVAVAAGAVHTVALMGDSTVYAWGANSSGQLGAGDTDDRITAVKVKAEDGSDLTGIAAIAAGSSHTVALTKDGKVLAWGNNAIHQVGVGNTSTRILNPVEVPVGSPTDKVVAIAAHKSMTLARLESGAVWTWGDNTFGQLGYDTTPALSSDPNLITAITGADSWMAGGQHTFVVDGATVWAWGANDHGQLGTATTGWQPTQVLNLPSTVVAVDTGSTHSILLLEEGNVWGWGGNENGQVGTNQPSGDFLLFPENPPKVVDSDGKPITRIFAVATSYDHSLALAADGAVWAWGKNDKGQLGDGSTTDRFHAVRVMQNATNTFSLSQDLKTKPSHYMGIYPEPITVKLACTVGQNTCPTNWTKYCFGPGCYPWNDYSSADGVLVDHSTILRFFSADPNGSSEPVRTYEYFIYPDLQYKHAWRRPEKSVYLGQPNSIAVSDGGSIFVTDPWYNRVMKLDSKGDYVTQWGVGTLNYGGTNPMPIGIAAWSDRVTVSLQPPQLVDFDEDGFFPMVNEGAGLLWSPAGVAVDPLDNRTIYVADTAFNSIFKFGGWPRVLLGGLSGAEFGFNSPKGVAIGPAPNYTLYVNDQGNGRIWGMTEYPNVQTWSVPGIMEMVVLQDGDLLASDGLGVIKKYKASDPAAAPTPWRVGIGQPKAVDASGNVYALNDFARAIKKYSSKGEFLARLTEPAAAGQDLRSPVKVAVDSDGNIHVADYGNGRIAVFTPAGEYLREYGRGYFVIPYSIAAGSDRIFVLDTWASSVKIFAQDGTYLGQLLTPGSAVALDSKGILHVAESNRIAKYDATSGEYLGFILGSGEISYPQDIAIDGRDNLYVLDALGIRKFNSSGQYQWAAVSDKPVWQPMGIAARGGYLYVADYFNNSIHQFNATGDFVTEFGALKSSDSWTGSGFVRNGGSGNGMLLQPNGVGVGLDGSIYVADTGNDRLQKFEPSGTKVTVRTSPAGRSFNVDGTVYWDSHTFLWKSGTTHSLGVLSPQTLNGTTRFNYSAWSDGGSQSHDIGVTDVAETYTVNFNTEYQLATAVSPAGSGKVSPASGGWYPAGATVSLKAFPNSGYSFVHWTGAVADNMNAATTIVMNDPQAVTANQGGVPSLTAAMELKQGTVDARIWRYKLTNGGQGDTFGAGIKSMTITPMSTYPGCNPVKKSTFPVISGSGIIPPNTFGYADVLIDFSSCPSTAKYSVTITYGAANCSDNKLTLTNQYR